MLTDQFLDQSPKPFHMLMIVARADQPAIETARVRIVGQSLHDVNQICAQLRAHHEVKGGVERGRQDILRSADLAAAAALKILRDAIPVVVGGSVLVLIEKECIEQGFVLRIERLASCFQFFQIGGHFLIVQIAADHAHFSLRLPHASREHCQADKGDLIVFMERDRRVERPL